MLKLHEREGKVASSRAGRPPLGRRRTWKPQLERLESRVVPGFLAPLAFDGGYDPQSVAVADFNGDGHSDLAVADAGTWPLYAGRVNVLLGMGDGTFQAAQSFPAGRYSHSVAVGDFNGDGRLDLAVANSTDV